MIAVHAPPSREVTHGDERVRHSAAADHVARSRPPSPRRAARDAQAVVGLPLPGADADPLRRLHRLLPSIYAFYLSFHEWNILEPAKPFVGLDNYRRLLDDERFGGAIVNTLYYTAASVPLTMGIGLLIALLLNNQIRARGFFRTLFYLPVGHAAGDRRDHLEVGLQRRLRPAQLLPDPARHHRRAAAVALRSATWPCRP